MSAIYDEQVKITLYNYEQTLINSGSVYHVSKQRRMEKLSRLRSFLQSLSNAPTKQYPVCDKANLGQRFKGNKPLDANLRVAYYKDESGTQWSVSFYRISQNKVGIHRLLQSQHVKESKRGIRITEFQLRRIIESTVRQALNDILMK